MERVVECQSFGVTTKQQQPEGVELEEQATRRNDGLSGCLHWLRWRVVVSSSGPGGRNGGSRHQGDT